MSTSTEFHAQSLERHLGNFMKDRFETYFAKVLVEIELPLVVNVMVVVWHSWIRIEDELQIDARRGKRDLGVSFSASVLETDFALFLRPVTESRVTDLRKHKNFIKWRFDGNFVAIFSDIYYRFVSSIKLIYDGY